MRTEVSYLGLKLPHPFIAGASPYGYSIDRIKRLEDAGCAAIVLHSLFEEQIEGSNDPELRECPFGPDEYARHIVHVKEAIHMPVIASLNGCTSQSWLAFSSVIEQAGADALEINLYDIVTDLDIPGTFVEGRIIDTVAQLKAAVRIPVAVKLTPFFSALGNMAKKLDHASVDALVLFNRFYQPDIDIRSMAASPAAELSTNAELRLRLRWLAILHGRVRPALAVTGGIVEPNDGIKAILAGATVVQLVSALLRHGPAYVSTMRNALEQWLDWRQLASVDEMRGTCSLEAEPDPAAFERAQYIRTLHSWTT
jgi:dihydroorotate dehydrogenase (fumarate)